MEPHPVYIFFLIFFKLIIIVCTLTYIVRTRGAGFQPKGRRRPITSTRRGDRGASSSAPPVGGDAGEVVGFPGGTI